MRFSSAASRGTPRRALLLGVTLLVLAVLVSVVTAQEAFDAGSGNKTEVERAATPTPTPTPLLDTYTVPAPSAMPGSTAFAYTPNVQCDEVVANASMRIYMNNQALFTKCVLEGKYQIFPYTGTLPTKEQIDSMVRAESCRSVFTACVLGNLPQCDIGGMALKSATETLLKIAIDVLEGKEVPDSKKFYELLLWRRDVNLAQAKGLAYDQNSQLYSEYSRNLWEALTNTNVLVSHDLTISFEGSGSKDEAVTENVFLNVSSGSDVSDLVGKVRAPDTSGSADFSNKANATSASSERSARSAVMGMMVASVVLWVSL